jgi:hypothetical protein
MARARTPAAKAKPATRAKPKASAASKPKATANPRAKPTAQAKPAAKPAARARPKPAPKSEPKASARAEAQRLDDEAENGAPSTDDLEAEIAQLQAEVKGEQAKATPASTGCAATTLTTGVCGLKILVSVGGVDVSAERLCQGHYAMRHGSLSLVSPLVSAP